MSKLFQYQSNAVISIDTQTALGGASVTRILYKKPNGLKGFWPATISGTVMSYSPADTDLDQAGEWELQAYAEIAGKKAYGAIIKEFINKPLNV
jgi:hypothetical protein